MSQGTPFMFQRGISFYNDGLPYPREETAVGDSFQRDQVQTRYYTVGE